MKKSMCIIIVFIAIFLFFPSIFYKKHNEYFQIESLKTEESFSLYLKNVENIYSKKLLTVLADISNIEDAKRGVIELLKLNQQIHQDYYRLDNEIIKNKDEFSAHCIALLFIETEFKGRCAEIDSKISAEYRRLKSMNFYNNDALKYVINTHFINKELPKWYPFYHITHRLNTPYKAESLKEVFENEYLKIRKERQIDETITLQVLDLYYHFPTRSNALISPFSYQLRGNDLLFLNCFCSDYCFNHASPFLRMNRYTGKQKELWKIHPCALYKMKPKDVKKLSGFKKEVQNEYGIILLFELDNRHFISKYLVLKYQDKLDSIGFTDDISRYMK